MDVTPETPLATVVVIEDADRYAEGWLVDDEQQPIGLHLESSETAFVVSYTIEQARALHEALGHLIWLATHNTKEG
jgi:hypothetical protein